MTEDFETAYARAMRDYERDLRLRQVQIGMRIIMRTRRCTRVILILMKVGISTSTWFQNVPFCSLISEQFLFLFYNHSFRKFFGLQWEFQWEYNQKFISGNKIWKERATTI